MQIYWKWILPIVICMEISLICPHFLEDIFTNSLGWWTLFLLPREITVPSAVFWLALLLMTDCRLFCVSLWSMCVCLAAFASFVLLGAYWAYQSVRFFKFENVEVKVSSHIFLPTSSFWDSSYMYMRHLMLFQCQWGSVYFYVETFLPSPCLGLNIF